jgi:hypothetical protein
MAKTVDSQELLKLLEDGIRKILKDPNAKLADRLKAIETGAKLLAIRHKVEGGGTDGSFFASGR